MNHAKWLKEYLTDHTPSANLSLLLDSSWFINFKGDIEREFHTALASEDGSASSPTTHPAVPWKRGLPAVSPLTAC